MDLLLCRLNFCHLLTNLDNMFTLKFSCNLKGKNQHPCPKPNNMGEPEVQFRPT